MNNWAPPFYIGVLVALFGVFLLNSNLLKVYNRMNTPNEDKRLKVLLISQKPNRFEIEKKVFEFLDYQQVHSFSSQWDVLWTNDPFHQHEKHIKQLQPHQRINHFPGLSHLTIKKQLATNFQHHNFIPRGFTFPHMKNEFLDFVAKNPGAKFVEKAWKNRGVRLIENINEVLSESFDVKEKFVQVFVHNPLLIDNRMFDIGVYVLITSFAPLRVYRFSKEFSLRFCAKDYHPFAEDTQQYVIADDSTPVWEIPSLRDSVLKSDMTSKAALEGYLNRHGHNTTWLWRQMDEIIVSLLIENEQQVIRDCENFGDPSMNFFEILRFDFIIDESLKVNLMEVQMSPHLGDEKDTETAIKRGYRSQILYDALTLMQSEIASTDNENYLIFDPRDISVPSSETNMTNCEDNCESNECNLSAPCIGKSRILQQTFREHMRRRRMQRIFPKAMNFNKNDDLIGKMHPRSKFILKWIYERCRLDNEWC